MLASAPRPSRRTAGCCSCSSRSLRCRIRRTRRKPARYPTRSRRPPAPAHRPARRTGPTSPSSAPPVRSQQGRSFVQARQRLRDTWIIQARPSPGQCWTIEQYPRVAIKPLVPIFHNCHHRRTSGPGRGPSRSRTVALSRHPIAMGPGNASDPSVPSKAAQRIAHLTHGHEVGPRNVTSAPLLFCRFMPWSPAICKGLLARRLFDRLAKRKPHRMKSMTTRPKNCCKRCELSFPPVNGVGFPVQRSRYPGVTSLRPAVQSREA